MEILVLPISGGCFCAQLAILQHLCNCGYVPDVSLGSSGGNLCAYVAAAADWNAYGIVRVASQLNNELFLTEWAANPSLSKVVGFFKGYTHQQGIGVKKLIESFFTPSSIAKYEIWTGTYNNTKKKARVFCNRSESTAKLNCKSLNTNLLQCIPVCYASGDIDLIVKVGVASASIPCIVPPQVIGGEEHMDGGLYGASPLTLLKDCIWKQAKDQGVHIVYVNAFDLSRPASKETNNVIDCYKQSTAAVVQSQIIMDRWHAHSLVAMTTDCDDLSHVTFECTESSLRVFLKLRRYLTSSLLEIYPLVAEEINLARFDGRAVVDAMAETYPQCMCHLWWSRYELSVNDVHSAFVE
jgi:predicted acylesterase/phospholipase RssA